MYVLELSSRSSDDALLQLEAAAVLNVTPDHLDRYRDSPSTRRQGADSSATPRPQPR